MEKKTIVITYRTSEATKEKLQVIANKNDWTISKLSERIITKFIEDQEQKIIQATIEDLMKTIMYVYDDSTEASDFGIKLERELADNYILD